MKNEYKLIELQDNHGFELEDVELKRFLIDFLSDDFTEEAFDEILDFCNTLDDVLVCRTSPYVLTTILGCRDEEEALETAYIIQGFIESI